MMTDRIDRLARRVEADPFFLASALAEYARGQRLDECGLTDALGCSLETLTRLRLCRRPRPEPGLFQEDIDRIARRFRVRADLLAQAVRRADALATMRRATAPEGGLLAAARDREELEQGNEPKSGEQSG
jgi:hypothetical protein